ncbi:MAG TPA: radical SAM protein, partial [Anaerovoracaceae bacterium]|nr:radical SAM protein [Anaerovoracaceae bacterium]
MKPSRYNFVFPYQFNRDYSVVYNAFRDTVGIVTVREAEFVKSCDRSLGIHDTKIDDFKNKGFIVDANINELSILKVEYLKSKFDTKLLSVVIVPTYHCNLDCAYCYEKLSYSAVDNTIMNEQVQDSICRWIEKNLHGVEKLEIFWHGGEPLVAFDVVKRLGGMLKNLAEQRNIEFVSKMSTNGYLFTESVAEELKELGITQYKMSMDGCRENHDYRKRHKDGSATYDTILGNIQKSIAYVDGIDLRINVDKEDLQDAYDIMRILDEKGLSEKVIPRLGKPRKFAGQINDET